MNSRMDELQAGFLNLFLKDADNANLKRNKIINKYHQAFKEIDSLYLPQLPSDPFAFVGHFVRNAIKRARQD